MLTTSRIRRGVARGFFQRLAVIVAVGSISCPDACAEFYVWRDAMGHKRISNLPPQGFASNGDLRSAHDPNSIVYQHARMLEILNSQREAIARERERGGSDIDELAGRAPAVRNMPREGIMNLDELIALEKRGGRWEGAPPDQSGGTRSK